MNESEEKAVYVAIPIPLQSFGDFEQIHNAVFRGDNINIDICRLNAINGMVVNMLDILDLSEKESEDEYYKFVFNLIGTLIKYFNLEEK